MNQTGTGDLILALASMALGLAAGHARANEQERHLRFTVTIENPAAQRLQQQSVSIYMPVAETGTQELARLEVNWPHRIRNDAGGNTILELTLTDVAPYATHVVSIDATMKIRPLVRGTPLATGADYLAGQPYIEVADPAIRNLAGQLHQANALETAEAIYHWVRSNLQYAGFVPDDLGAKVALSQRRGDCTEYAYLVAALARANGIPARVLGGYVTAIDAAPRSRDYHNWAELHIDGAWRLVDAQKERFLSGTDEYVAMRIVSSETDTAMGSSHRFTVKGSVVVHMD